MHNDEKIVTIMLSRKVPTWWTFAPPTFTKEGGERMTDYELIMINLTVLSLVVGLLVTLITINKR